jgi:hypothetical protein
MRSGAAKDAAVCSACWLQPLEAGAPPARVLDSDDDHEPDDNFWIVDNCAGCGREVRYRSARALD